MKVEVLQLLSQVAKRWQQEDYSLRQQAIAEAAPEYCLSKPSFELALNWIFEQWTPENLAAKAALNPYSKLRSAAQILAGTTPAMIAQGFIQGIILDVPQVLKIPRQQGAFAKLLHQSFPPELAKRFELHQDFDSFHQALASVDLVLAYGHDDTLEEIKASLKPTVNFVAHGTAESAALILQEADPLAALENLAYDFLSYDQRGCLSPRVTYVEKNAAEMAKLFAEEVLPKVAKQLPRGGLFPGEAEAILHQSNRYGFRGKVYHGEDWTLCFEENQEWPELNLPRFMVFKPLEDWQRLVERSESLISLGYAGSQDRIETLKTPCCLLGQMQRQLLCF